MTPNRSEPPPLRAGTTISFGDQTIVKGDVVGGNKTEIKFYVAATLSSGRIDWRSRGSESADTQAEPYKFLSYYDTSDCRRFYGRDDAIQELLSKITTFRVVQINGKSGCGKTSLIHAGLVKPLCDAGYFVATFRDYGYPTDLIRTGISELPEIAVRFEGNEPLATVLGTLTTRTTRPLAIFLDQFERFFNLSVDERTRFANELKSCFERLRAERICFIISIREDFYGRLGEFWKIIPEFYTESYPYHLTALRADEALEAIRKPLLDSKVSYDPHFLKDRLIPDLQQINEEGLLQIHPVQLQIICSRLFAEVKERYATELREGDPVIIGQELYTILKGARGILAGYVQTILNRDFANGESDTTRELMKKMVSPAGIRVFIKPEEVSFSLRIQTSEALRILKRLEASRLVEARSEQNTYSLAHEHLIEIVKEWFNEEELDARRALNLYTRALADYQDDRSLIRWRRFHEYRKFKSLFDGDTDGQALYRRSRNRYYLIVCFLIALVSIPFDLLAYYGYHQLYLVPNDLGLLEVSSAAGEISRQSVTIAGFNQQKERRVVQSGSRLPASFKLPRGLYYVEVPAGQYLRKYPILIEGYRNYSTPIRLVLPSATPSSTGMRFVEPGEFTVGSPLVFIGDESMDKLKGRLPPDVYGTLGSLARRSLLTRDEFLRILREALPALPYATEQLILRNADTPSDEEALKRRSVFVGGFYIDVHEVTNDQYAEFLKSNAASVTHYPWEPEEKRTYGHKPKDLDSPFYPKYSRGGDYPVIGVDWHDAYAYCAWLGKRLPTGLEWEKAASWVATDDKGKKGEHRVYPWGNPFFLDLLNSKERWPQQQWDDRSTEPVDSHRDGASPYGLLNMAGNVYEWTDAWYDPLTITPDADRSAVLNAPFARRQTLRGGSFAQDQFSAQTFRETWQDMAARDLQFGFRCAVSALP